MMLRVRFQCDEYLFVNARLDDGGPIATAEQYQQGLCSFAHLQPNGDIKQFGKTIGHRDDLIVIEQIADVEPGDPAEALVNMIDHPSWPDYAHILAMGALIEAVVGTQVKGTLKPKK